MQRTTPAGGHVDATFRGLCPDGDLGQSRRRAVRHSLLPVNAPAQQSSKSPSPFAEAEALYQQGSVEEAKRKIEEQLRQNPRSVEGYNLLGIIYTSEKNYAQALDAFQQALTVDPKSARTRNNIGNVYVAQQNLVLAEQEFRKVLQVDPANSDGNYNLGVVLLAKGAPAQAIAYFQRVRPFEYCDAAQHDSCLSSGRPDCRRSENGYRAFFAE